MKDFADVSHYQGVIDWAQYRSRSDVVVINAMDGTRRDPQFFRNRDQTRARGFTLVVYYHYLFAGSDVGRAARAFVELLADIRPWETVCLDIEEGHGDQTNRVDLWQTIVDNSIINRRSWIYTGDHFAQTQLDWPRVSHRRTRWVARYSRTPPRTPHDVWQYTSSGRINGVEGPVDLNRYGPQSRALRALSMNHKPKGEGMTVVHQFNQDALDQLDWQVQDSVRHAVGKDHGKDGHASAQVRARAREGATEATAGPLAAINTKLDKIMSKLGLE